MLSSWLRRAGITLSEGCKLFHDVIANAGSGAFPKGLFFLINIINAGYKVDACLEILPVDAMVVKDVESLFPSKNSFKNEKNESPSNLQSGHLVSQESLKISLLIFLACFE